MSRYIVLMKQVSEGCGHSIACGKNFKIIESDMLMEELEESLIKEIYTHGDYSLDDSSHTFEEMVKYYSCDLNEFALESLVIISLETREENHVDLYMWERKVNDFKQALKDKEQKEKQSKQDAEDLERLKKLFPEKFK